MVFVPMGNLAVQTQPSGNLKARYNLPFRLYQCKQGRKLHQYTRQLQHIADQKKYLQPHLG
jgi:hypothetical protein